MRRVGIVFDEFSGSTHATGTSRGADSLAVGCGMGERDGSDSGTDVHHQLAQVDLVGLCQVQDEVLHQVVVARACHRCVDLVYFVGPNQRLPLRQHRQEHLSVSVR